MVLAAVLLAVVGLPPVGPAFRDVTAESGLSFRFDRGSRGKHDLPEIMGGGVALIDADADGRLDVFLGQGGPIARGPGRDDPPCRLFLNLGGMRFRDVSAGAGCPGPSYAMGAAVGDVDGDGRDDLLVTGWGEQRFYRNLGAGRFEDATDHAGLASDRWGTSAAFADLDDDGDLDLYVCHYVDYDPASAPFCAAPDGRRDYCGPEDFPAQADRLYRNDGGRFTDVSKPAGIEDREGRGLGVVIADLIGDSRPDLFVANDGTPCRLYENLGGMIFRETGSRSGTALDGTGRALAGMGVAVGDLDGDGRPDLLVSNFLGRSTIGFVGLGEDRYADSSAALGLVAATRSVLGFGLALDDFDLDSDLDMLQANGHVLDRERLGEPLAMRPTLLRNEGGKLLDASRSGGPAFDCPAIGRGVAVGDLDDDGRPDAVIASLDAPALVLRNESTTGGWMRLDVRNRSGRPAIGAVVRATVEGRVMVRPVAGGSSYLSSSDRRLTLGLGRAASVDRLEVAWPSGRVERFAPPAFGGVSVIQEGSGLAGPVEPR